MVIRKENTGYSANTNIKDVAVYTQGETFKELQDNIIEAVNLAVEETGIVYGIDEIKFNYDLQSFFSFYRVINVKAFSERIGMNQSLLAQYINGTKKPSPAQTRRIMDGVKQIGKELSEVNILL